MNDELTHGGLRIDPQRARWTMWGEVDTAVHRQVEVAAAEHLHRTADETMTVDLGEVTFIDSGGLRLLYAAAEAKPTPPRLVSVPPKVLDLLKISGVDTMFILET